MSIKGGDSWRGSIIKRLILDFKEHIGYKI